MQSEDVEVVELRQKLLMARLLYPNPVCILTTAATPDHAYPNAMTISWLSCINNTGLVMLSMNQNRHTAARIVEGGQFVLNIPVAGMEELVLAIGSCHGGDKLAALIGKHDLDLCCPGWGEHARFDPENPSPHASHGPDPRTLKKGQRKKVQEAREAAQLAALPAVRQAVAHLVLTVSSKREVDGGDHWLLVAQIDRAWVQKAYWATGKTLAAPPGWAPILSFLGSQTFGHVVLPAGELTAATSSKESLAPSTQPKVAGILWKRRRGDVDCEGGKDPRSEGFQELPEAALRAEASTRDQADWLGYVVIAGACLYKLPQVANPNPTAL